MYEYDVPDATQHVTERLVLVVDVTTDGCGVTRAMRNVALHAAMDGIRGFNLVVRTTPVRTEIDGDCLLEH